MEKDCGERRWCRWCRCVSVCVGVCVVWLVLLVHGHFAEEKKRERERDGRSMLCRTPTQTYFMSNECNR